MRVVRRRAAVAAGAVAAVALLARALGAGAQTGALERIRRRGHLVAGVPLWLPPFGSPGPGGGWIGLDAAAARAVATIVLGNPARAHLLPLSAGERRWAVRSGTADLVAAAFSAPDPGAGGQGIALVGPYFADGLSLLVRRDAPVRLWTGLDGRRLGVLSGSGAGALVQAAAGRRATPVLEEVGSAAVAAGAIALGDLRGLVAATVVCQALTAYDRALVVQNLPGVGLERYWVLVSAATPDLAEAVREGLATLPQGRQLRAALRLWSQEGAQPPF